MGLFFEDDGRDVSFIVDMGGQADYFPGADRDAQAAPFALFGIYNNIS
jgi:hypothetical protein